ncbi:MAG TPA: tryptophan 2,3-dioxygenase family protein [Actinomycetes bacterium]|nr:tryptophan 2,3-dioxygenase family protein [Actinomycetes bacterium]
MTDAQSTEADRHFGEQGARLTYGSYLRVAELLDQQRLESDPPAHDELLFITVHQVYELWFKQLLHELTAARQEMFAGNLWRARHLLARVVSIEDVLIRQIAVLETMTPQDFLEFRDRLAPASGFQSVQFRELEFLSGAKDPGYLERFRGLTDDERDRLQRRLDEPSLWDAFLHVVRGAGLAADDDAALTRSMLAVAGDRATHGEVWELAERLLDHDANAAMWRSRHVLMVERQIGTKSGTGGSSGAPYLRSRLGLHYFPLLWELRSHL